MLMKELGLCASCACLVSRAPAKNAQEEEADQFCCQEEKKKQQKDKS